MSRCRREPDKPPRRTPRPPQNPPQNAEADPGVVPRRLEFRRKLMKIIALSKSGVQVGPRGRTDGQNPKVIGCPSALALVNELARSTNSRHVADAHVEPFLFQLHGLSRGSQSQILRVIASLVNKSPVALLSYRGGVKHIASCWPINHQ